LAENADRYTIKTFLSASPSGIDHTGVDSKGYTAMDYLSRRREVDELMEPFQALVMRLNSAKLARTRLSRNSDESERGIEEVDSDHFFDAVEVQPEA
jgi:hypothetical protein